MRTAGDIYVSARTSVVVAVAVAVAVEAEGQTGSVRLCVYSAHV
jgi:hypothetical protein